MIWAMTPPIEAPMTCARSMCSWSSTAIDVEGHALERVRLGRGAGAADAPVVDRDAAELAAHRQALQRPAPRVGAEALDHHERRAVPAPEDVVVDGHAVVDDDLRHRTS